MGSPLRLGVVLLFLLFVASAGLGAESSERVKRVEIASKEAIRFSTLAVHPNGRKLYAGQSYASALESGLWVFDIDTLGDLTSTDERIYPLLPPGSKPNPYVTVNCMAFSRDGRKLYYGLTDSDESRGNFRPLGVQDLDEKGEPVGKPRTYVNGNVRSCIWDILPHPKGGFLYTLGWGGEGLFALPLAKGEPSGEPITYSIGINGSMVPSDSWDLLILGGYPSVLKMCEVNGDGGVEKPFTGDQPIKVSDCKIYLRLFRIGHGLFFENENCLVSWTLSKSWQPAGKPRRHPEIRTGLENGSGRIAVAGGSLFVAQYDIAADAATKKEVSKGFRILELKPSDAGDLGKPAFESPLIPNAACASLAVDGKSGVIYVSY
jgi:hypothetical protein